MRPSTVILVLVRLFVKTYLNQRQRRDIFGPRVKPSCYDQSIYLKVGAISLSALLKDTKSELAGLFFRLPLYNAERQAEKL